MMENRYGKDRGIYYFSRGQLVVLGLAFMATSVLIFVLGVLIGQRIEERKLVKKEGPLVKIPVQPLPKGSSPGAAAAKEEMTFYETLAKGGAQPTRTESTKQTQRAEKAVKPAVKEEKPSAGEVKAASTEKAPRPSEAEVQEAVWTVQVNAFPIEEPAQSLVKTLKDKGYDAYLVRANIKGKTWYRVRVGRFTTREKARELQEVLMTKENFTGAMTVSR